MPITPPQGQELYREDIKLPFMNLAAAGLVIAALVFVGLVFINPFAEITGRNQQTGVFWIPAALLFALALFAISFGKFTIIVTPQRLSVGAGMNANSVAWSEIESVGEDYSRRQPRNVLTAVPIVLDGQSAMVYAIGDLPRVELVLKNEHLRRLIFPTRQPDVLLSIIKDRSRKARGMPVISEKEQLEMVSVNAFGKPGTFDGIGGPPPFSLP